jgi:aspartyl protease family protein
MTDDPEQTPDLPPAPRRMGAAMIVVSWLVVLAIVSMLFADLLEDQFNPNTQVVSRAMSSGAIQVALQQNRQGHYVATGRINDAPVVFLVDTGATDVSVPAGLAKRIGLERGPPMEARTANGTVTTYLTTLNRVQLGDIVIDRVRASINPGMQGNEVLLGMSFLRQLDLNQSGRILTMTLRGAS